MFQIDLAFIDTQVRFPSIVCSFASKDVVFRHECLSFLVSMLIMLEELQEASIRL